MEIATLEQIQQMRSWLRCACDADGRLIEALPSLAADEGDSEGEIDGAIVVAL